jgi:opacity protein-like surface antigen
VSYRFERTTLEGSYVRDVSPSSAGQLLTKNTVSLSLRQRATPVITFSFRGLYQENESANLRANSANNDRTYWSVTPGAHWAFLPDWTASASYRYRSNQSGGSGRRAVSNAVRMAVTYRLPAR